MTIWILYNEYVAYIGVSLFHIFIGYIPEVLYLGQLSGVYTCPYQSGRQSNATVTITCSLSSFIWQPKNSEISLVWHVKVYFSLTPLLLCVSRLSRVVPFKEVTQGFRLVPSWPAWLMRGRKNWRLSRDFLLLQRINCTCNPLVRTSHVFPPNCNGCWEKCLLCIQYEKEHHYWWAVRSTPVG